MLNSKYDLISYYPFMPFGEAGMNTADVDNLKGALGNILDIHIVLEIPACNPESYLGSENNINVVLAAIHPDHLELLYSIKTYGINSTLLEIPVNVYGSDFPDTSNYAIARSTPVSMDTSMVLPRIHPDCILFRQISPRFIVHKRENIDAQGVSHWSETSVWKDGNPLGFKNGHNVGVALNSNTVEFSFMPGAGMGTYESIPWYYTNQSSVGNKRIRYTPGLSSINGISDSVSILGSPSCLVETFYDTRCTGTALEPEYIAGITILIKGE